MLPRHFYAMAHGYLKKEYTTSAELRKLGFLTVLPHMEKNKASFQKFCDNFWPLALDKEFIEQPEVAVSPLADLSPEERKKRFLEIMHQHNPKRFKKPEPEENK